MFRHTDTDAESVGGELYVYRRLNHGMVTKEGLEKQVCSNARLLQCACFVAGPAYVAHPDDYLTSISIEIVRDMKASLYLAMSGHYRQAILIQRSVLENFLYGLYFHADDYTFSKDEEDRREVQRIFRQWLDGGFRKPDDYLLDLIERAKLIDRAEKKELRKLFGQLSQFVHTILHTPTGQRIKYGRVEISGCEAAVEFDKNSLLEWSVYYQRLFFFVLLKLLTVYPVVKKGDAGRLALGYLRAEFGPVAKELSSPYLDELLRMRGGKAPNAPFGRASSRAS